MNISRGNAGYLAAAIAAIALLVWWAWPQPHAVETARIGRGPVQVVVEEDGEMRAVDRYGIASPVAGRLLRITLKEGNAVRAGETVAQIAPLPISATDRDMLEAKLASVQALRVEATERVRRAESDAAQSERERVRVEDLVARKFMSQQALEQAEVTAKMKATDLQAARSRAMSAAADVEVSRAALTAIRAKAPTVRVISPVSARVLRVLEKSERVVQPGMVLVTVGDPGALEVVVDVLSNDAVRVRPGMRMLLTGWGGSETAEAVVRTVEPAAFTKVSALGVEEQRVNVVADFKRVPPGVGDAYRVDARIVIAEKPDALQVPVGALFRRGDQWCVFLVGDGRIAAKTVQLGLRGAREAEVIAGLAERDEVVLYPGNNLGEGDRVVSRR